jgi:DNA-binding NarL/FixJ family response regulator
MNRITYPPMRALIVEDDSSWQQILTEILNDCDMEVDVAESYEEAVKLIRTSSHRIAVMDLSLGGTDHSNQDGLKVLDAVNRLDPECISIFLTGFATVELAVSLIHELGAYTCLRKETFRRADFRRVINYAMIAFPPGSGERREAVPAARPAAIVETEAPVKEGSAGSVLVAEDDAGWRSLLTELLVDAGYRVEQCSSYVQALGALRREVFQLAVVDLSLASSLHPDANQDGYRLLATTQKLGIATIIVSGYAEPAVIERAYSEYQLFACLEKQAFDRKTFRSTVDRARLLRQAGSGLQALTGREREVLALLARGMTNKEIANALVITPNTVKRHLKSLFAKLEVNTRSAASAIATRAGIVD